MAAVSESADGLSLRPYLQTMRRRWLVMVGFAVLVPVISVLVALGQSPVYSASSEVLIRRDNLAASLTPGQVGYTDAQTAERVIETQVQLARVPVLAERVLQAAGTPGSATEFLDSSTAMAKPKTDIVVLTVENGSQVHARVLANVYAREFSAYRRQLDTTELDSLARAVRGQLATIGQADDRTTPLSQDLQDKLRQIQTLQTLQTSSAVVVREADRADKVKPKPATMGIGGLVLGLMLAAGVAFLLDSLDDRVRESRQVDRLIGLPLLARLPEPPKELESRSRLVMLDAFESPEGEAFTFLQTSLTFANVAPAATVIIFSSAIEQEGKSTTVANLGVSYARSGHRVVLVDFDHRRPTLHRFFGIPQGPGVTGVASGQAGLEQALVRVALPAPGRPGRKVETGEEASLRVLPAGSPTNKIDVEAAADMIRRLRADADIVLVDACPLLLVGETMALVARMDAVVVIARLGFVRRSMLEELRRALEAAPVRALGYILTGAGEEAGYSRHYRQVSEYGAVQGDLPDELPGVAPTPLPSQPPVPVVVESAVAAQAAPPAHSAVSVGDGWEGVPVGSADQRHQLLDAVFAAVPSARRPATSQTEAAATGTVRPRRSWESWASGRPAPTPGSSAPSVRHEPPVEPAPQPADGSSDAEQPES